MLGLISSGGVLLRRIVHLPLLLCLLCCSSLSVAAEPPQVLLMMSGHSPKPKANLLVKLAKDQPFVLTAYSMKGKSDEQIAQAWGQADLVLLDGINPMLSEYMFAGYAPLLTQFANTPVISLGDLTNRKMNQGVDLKISQTIAAYYKNAGRQNYRHLMSYLAAELFELTKAQVPAPIQVPDVGLYHPDYPTLVTANEAEFFNWLQPETTDHTKKPVIAMAIHRSVLDYEQQQVVDAVLRGLEAKGAKALGFFFEGEDKGLTYPELLMENGQSRVDLLINYRTLHYVNKRRAEFAQLGVPVIHALNYSKGDEAEYLADPAGIPTSLTPFFLVMPEDTGSADPIVLAATHDGTKTVIQPHLEALVERAYNQAALAHIPNSDKKIATFIWNYPPGEKNVGAAFLDVPASIAEISKAMQAQGYSVTPKEAETLIEWAGELLRPTYRNEDFAGLIEKGLADWLPLSDYNRWFKQLPESVRAPIIERWGQPEENQMLAEHQGEKAFVIPRMALGNLIVLPQGVRGKDPQEHAALYHDTKTPVSHAYLAVYLYARQIFAADAVIHLGTHGSQEWLTGKERGLSVFDAPNLVMGNVPVFYPYIIDNVGEAMQAKRRGRATMISHLTPGFAKAGFYSDIAQLNELISNYWLLEQGQTQLNTQREIVALSQSLNLLDDLDLDEGSLLADFNQQISRVQDHLTELAELSQPLGVHTFGLLPQESHQISTILQMLGDEFQKEAAVYEKEQGLSLPVAEQLDERQVRKLEALDGFQLLKATLIEQQPVNQALPESLQLKLAEAQTYWQNFHQIAEIEHLMKALGGKYIPVGYGGDPIRNPDAAPTGRNLIGFNPAKVPSKQAYEAGVVLMEQTLADYRAKHGRYPNKLAFSLWSLETMRHHGALEAQILHALGVKPKWNRQGNVQGVEVIPMSELKRPRVDVVISATGLYRDAFPNVMLWLAEAIDQIAKMKEENNFVYRHASALKETLLAEGKSEADADYLSSVRIFSNESGNYGTGLAGSSLASDTWETDDKLADLYLRRMGFAFGKDESRWSENVSSSALYSKVLSGTEGVIFSRSTNLYALMTNDDPFQYFGGIGLAVRHLDGKTPEMYVSNLRRKDKVRVQKMDEFINQEMRSRYFHPRWIQAMQESGYAGATQILDRVNNMWGWEVMTPEAIRDDHWQELFEVYVDDKYQLEMRAFFEQHNAHALAQMLERMMEAVRKGYWPADPETLKKMVETYTELANQFDVATENQKFTDFVNEQAMGFGLAPLLAAQAPEVMATPATATQQVSGKKLEQQVQAEQTQGERHYWWWSIAAIFAVGFFSHGLERKTQPLAAA